MQGKFLFLGTGASTGVPVIGCRCDVCRSTDPRNHRLRPSGLLKIGEKRFLIDAGPDYRQQALKFDIERLDGVLITHAHFDHIAGLDDLRVYYFLHHSKVACLMSRASFEELKIRNHYILEGAQLDFQVMEADFGRVDFGGEMWHAMTYEQVGMKVAGYRWGNFAYVMDMKIFPHEIYAALQGVTVLVLSGLRHRVSPAHLTLDEAVAFARKVGAEQTWLSHVAHELEHVQVNRQLPVGIQLAYDGLEVDVT